ncbi:MAG: hypothetical protein NZ455_09030 [Bacteroidia bacterium]|nr:hypothetical protein [Bacteroidia bacterium]MDW8346308.1 hypothetical protein [Bacteroidia bacterium]
MRHAEGVRQHGAKPLIHAQTHKQGVGGWGVAPLARSTPTRASARDTPKIKNYPSMFSKPIIDRTSRKVFCALRRAFSRP